MTDRPQDPAGQPAGPSQLDEAILGKVTGGADASAGGVSEDTSSWMHFRDLTYTQQRLIALAAQREGADMADVCKRYRVLFP